MRKRSPLLLKLMSRMGDLDFREAWIPRSQGCDVYGLWEPEGRVTINPQPHIVDTILHELLHELNPNYSERAVRSIVGKLLKGMTEEEMQAIYTEYKRRLEE